MVNIETNPLYYASLGGVLLGIATSINYCLRGKVTGMSGMVYGLISCHIGIKIKIKITSLKKWGSLEECLLFLASSLTYMDMNLLMD
jgi:hypothetical protein